MVVKSNINMTSQTFSIPLLSSEECDELVASRQTWVEGTVMKFGKFTKLKDVRSVEICNRDLPEELVDKIFRTIFHHNAQTYRYHLEGYNPQDPPLVFKYSADRTDHYTWHSDTVPGDIIRKLSFTIQLTDPSEYTGGDLEFLPAITDKKIRQKGMMTIFPSFMTHRVSPVTSGVRHTIVGWIHGPNFR
jgi:PKHD-type hydroxylase